MAALPGQPPLPGTPLPDPLGNVMVPGEPLPYPPPFAEELAGPPMPMPSPGPLQWPPREWVEEPAPPASFTGQDVPVVEPAVPTLPPPPAPAAKPQQAPQPGQATGDQATAQGGTGDPYLDYLDRSSQAHQEASTKGIEAKQAENEYRRQEELAAAQSRAQAQQDAEREYMGIQQEAKSRRQVLDQEAMAIANQKIDPKRAWRDMGLAGQIFTGIAAGLAGASTYAINTGGNQIVDMVQAIADRDMKAQAMDLENRTTALGMRRGLLADDLAAGRDVMDFRYKSLNAAYEIAKQQIDAYCLKYQNDALTAVGMEQKAAINDAQVKLGMDYIANTEKKLTEEQQRVIENRQRQQQIGIQSRAQAEQARHNMAEEEAARNAALGGPSVPQQRETREAEADKAARTVFLAKYKDASGKTGPVIGPKDTVVADVNKKLGLTTNFVQGLRRLQEIQKANGYKPFKEWGNDDLKEATAIYEGLVNDFSLAKEQGVVREEDYKRYHNMFGTIGGVLDALPKLKAVENLMIQSANNELQARVGPDVARWEPEHTPEASAYFQRGGMPKKQPAPAGLPAEGRAMGEAPLMTEEEKQFTSEGKFRPSRETSQRPTQGLKYKGDGEPITVESPSIPQAGNDMVLVRSASGEQVVSRSSLPNDPQRFQVMPDGSIYDTVGGDF